VTSHFAQPGSPHPRDTAASEPAPRQWRGLAWLLATLLLVVAPPSASGQDVDDEDIPSQTDASDRGPKACKRPPLRQGPMPVFRQLRLGKPKEFEFKSDGGRCFPVRRGDDVLLWVADVHAVGRKVYVRRCIEAEYDDSGMPITKGKKGYVNSHYEELRGGRGKGAPKLVKVDPPQWHNLSHPSFCGARMAYWGIKPIEGALPEVYAAVYNLKRKKLLKNKYIRSLDVETEWRDFFPAPEWDKAGKQAAFNVEQSATTVVVKAQGGKGGASKN